MTVGTTPTVVGSLIQQYRAAWPALLSRLIGFESKSFRLHLIAQEDHSVFKALRNIECFRCEKREGRHMRTHIALMVIAITTVTAFGLLAGSLANAGQGAITASTGISGTAGLTPVHYMLVKGGGMRGGGMHYGHFYNHRGFYGGYGYYPDYSNDYYTYSPNCYWNGYQFVCSDTSNDYYDTE
jgi:hypothetical protein